jgi:hypothetical protein
LHITFSEILENVVSSEIGLVRDAGFFTLFIFTVLIYWWPLHLNVEWVLLGSSIICC